MKNRKNLAIIEIAIFAALAMVFDYFCNVLNFKIWAQGGSVSIAMVPIFIVAYRWGIKSGLAAGFIFGLLQIISGTAYVVSIPQVFLDYIVAFTVLGFAGIFKNHIQSALNVDSIKWIYFAVTGVVFASILRYIAAVTSGVIFFSDYAPKGTPALEYSLVYNIGYLAPSIIICSILVIVLLKALPKKHLG
ncbi:MAG: thiamine biosynthesis protein ThiT [Bacillales bacterium]|jgi:thiamine transporter|nr:thiamine biosynthesis protein ThiT [Bacillales bacterium]